MRLWGPDNNKCFFGWHWTINLSPGLKPSAAALVIDSAYDMNWKRNNKQISSSIAEAFPATRKTTKKKIFFYTTEQNMKPNFFSTQSPMNILTMLIQFICTFLFKTLFLSLDVLSSQSLIIEIDKRGPLNSASKLYG